MVEIIQKTKDGAWSSTIQLFLFENVVFCIFGSLPSPFFF